MKLLAVFCFGLFISFSTFAFMGTGLSGSYSSCLPADGMGVNAPILFDANGKTRVNTSSEQIIATSRENGVEKIDYWAQVIEPGSSGSFTFKKVRAAISIGRKDGRPDSTTNRMTREGVEHVSHKTYEYDKNGRCRVAKKVSYQVKDGKVSDALVAEDAALCDKIVDHSKKNKVSAQTLNACATAFHSVSGIIKDHIKGYKDMSIRPAGATEDVKISPKPGAFSFDDGKFVPINASATQALLNKVSQCNFMGGVGLQTPVFGSDNFKLPEPPATEEPAPGGTENLTDEEEVTGTN